MGTGSESTHCLQVMDAWVRGRPGGHSILGCWDPGEEELCEPEGLFYDMIGESGEMEQDTQ